MTEVIEKKRTAEDLRAGPDRNGSVRFRGADEAAQLLAWLPKLHAIGGPRPCLYHAFDRWVHEVARALRDGAITRQELDAQILSLGSPYLEQTIQGHVFMRPHGYPGDFETIEAFYQSKISSDPLCARWDRYVQDQAAARAVRNRKDYFKALVKSTALLSGGQLDVLDLGSGPCRDVREFLDENPELDVHFTCVDQDRRAITHAANLCAGHPGRVELVEASLFRFPRQRIYGLVWSAGVMDYLDQDAATLFLRAAMAAAAPGSEVVIGNFSPDNPNRNGIEVMSRWYLHHRTPRQLFRIAENAGLPIMGLRMGMESEGINLFLHARKGA